jgi:hypothetical protein
MPVNILDNSDIAALILCAPGVSTKNMYLHLHTHVCGGKECRVCLSVCVCVGGRAGVGVFEADTRKIGSKDVSL